MFGRLVEIEGVDPSGRQEAEGHPRQDHPWNEGDRRVRGFIFLVDEESPQPLRRALGDERGRGRGGEQVRAYSHEIVSGMGGTVRSADLFEAALVEVLAGVHA